MGFNLSVAVAVGYIALAGVAAETGVVMLIYLDHALRERQAGCLAEGRPFTAADRRAAIVEGAVERVRPKMMAVVHPRPARASSAGGARGPARCWRRASSSGSAR